MRRIGTISATLAAAFTGLLMVFGAAAQPRIINVEVPPLLYTTAGDHVIGPAATVARRLAEDVGLPPVIHILPGRRLLQEVERGNSIVVTFVRTPEREAKFAWIGDLFTDSLSFAVTAPNDPVESLDQARKLGRIGVLAGSAPRTFLADRDFTNLELAELESQNALKLDRGRVDAWFASTALIKFLWREGNLNPKQLQLGQPIAILPFWVAATADIDPALVDRLRASFTRLRNGPEWAQIFSVLM